MAKIAHVGILLLAVMIPAVCGAGQGAGWPAWEAFNQRFVQADGRVIDLTFDGKSTSEGQSYALFFALVANQPARFRTVLQWSSSNLAWNQLGARLPAWLWGKRDDGNWGIKDQNPAADSDLWFAYVLLEAARLWQQPQYAEQARAILEQIKAQEVVEVEGVGPLLLPGPQGFKLDQGRVRLVTSYYPPFLFRYLATADAGGPWKKIWNNFQPLALKASAKGVAPDIFTVGPGGTIEPDSQQPQVCSYDAIRVYTWAGMSGASGAALVKQLAPYAGLIHTLGAPPEKAEVASGKPVASSYQPLGYSGAVLPFLKALGDDTELQRQKSRIERAQDEHRLGIGPKANYYDEALILFGQGWLEGRYRFDEQGRLIPTWTKPS